MKNSLSTFLVLSLFFFSCKTATQKETLVVTTDIDHFWQAFDQIKIESDSLVQAQLLQDLYLSKGSPGLAAMIQAKNYSPGDYLEMINTYPKYLASVRANTCKTQQLSKELESGIDQLRKVYPALKPAKIYFTIGAMRSGGTTLDSLVLIGSELAMLDKQADVSEFQGWMKDWITNYIDTKPLDNITLLNVHEYVHTQQNPIPSILLYQCLWEGVAEFVSTTAMQLPSTTPAISYGKSNPKVLQVFEKEMFFEQTGQWLWSSAPNQFDTRDLGYYIGYEICERYYQKANDKKQAISKLINIDYNNQQQLDAFIDQTNTFSQPVAKLRALSQQNRPQVTAIKQFDNQSKTVSPHTSRLTILFSEPMNVEHRGFELGPLGEENLLRVQKVLGFSEDAKAFSFEVQLEPNTRYQSLVSSRFRSASDIPLQPFLIDFETSH